jgi:hypothetical protein
MEGFYGVCRLTRSGSGEDFADQETASLFNSISVRSDCTSGIAKSCELRIVRWSYLGELEDR